jgi:hypothetical protein
MLLQVNVSANQLINSARLLSHPQQRNFLRDLAPLLPEFLQQQQMLTQSRDQTATADCPAAAAAAAAAADQGQMSQQELQLPPAAVASSSNKVGTYQQQQQGKAEPCSHQPQQEQQQQEQQQQEQQQPAVVVVGDQYYAAKDRLFAAEQVVLRLMSFQLGVDQPHKHLLNFCKLLGASRTATAAAVCILNDTLAYTNFCLTAEPAAVAAAALQLAVAYLVQQQQRHRWLQQQPGHLGTGAREHEDATVGNGAGCGIKTSRHHQQGFSSSSQEHPKAGRGAGASQPAKDQADSAAAAAVHTQPVAQILRPQTRKVVPAAAVSATRTSPVSQASLCAPAAAGVLEDGSWMQLVGLKQEVVFALVEQLQQTLQQLK